MRRPRGPREVRTCACGAAIWDVPQGRPPHYLEWIVCPTCGRDHSRRPPLAWRLPYGWGRFRQFLRVHRGEPRVPGLRGALCHLARRILGLPAWERMREQGRDLRWFWRLPREVREAERARGAWPRPKRVIDLRARRDG